MDTYKFQNIIDTYSLFCIKLEKMLKNIISEYDLPEHSLYLYSNISSKGKNKGKENSKSICFFEPEYPATKVISKPEGKNMVILNFKARSKTKIELLIRNTQFGDITVPDCAEVKELKSDQTFKHVIFDSTSQELFQYISANIDYCYKNYQASSSFGCCSSFEQCSDNKACVHPNKLYAKGCKYRMFLEDGKIFYGKNKNI